MSKETINRMRSIKENYKSGVEVALINLKEEYKRKVAYYNSNKLLGELEEDAPMRKQFDRVMKDYDNKIAFHKNTVRYSIEDVITYAQKENKEIEVYVNMTDMKAKIEVMGMNDEKTQIEKEKKNLEDRKKVLTKTIEKKTEMFPEDTELFVKEENKELKEINSKLEEINKKLQKIDDEISMYADRDNLLKAYNANLKLIKDMEKLAKDNKINLEDKSFGDNSIIPATTPETTPPTTPLSTPTTTPIKQDAQILFDMAKGEYTYIDSDGKEFKESMFDENGKEYLTEEDKKDIINELISKGVNEKVAKKVDPYIYDMLSYYNPELRDQYNIHCMKN